LDYPVVYRCITFASSIVRYQARRLYRTGRCAPGTVGGDRITAQLSSVHSAVSVVAGLWNIELGAEIWRAGGAAAAAETAPACSRSRGTPTLHLAAVCRLGYRTLAGVFLPTQFALQLSSGRGTQTATVRLRDCAFSAFRIVSVACAGDCIAHRLFIIE
jgi:hypothetical protein